MLNEARNPATLATEPWLWLAPGIAISLAVLTSNFIGDGLRDAFDVRGRMTGSVRRNFAGFAQRGQGGRSEPAA